jgi:Raf kinase inhibitor-like YbhB/YbcL family protein
MMIGKSKTLSAMEVAVRKRQFLLSFLIFLLVGCTGSPQPAAPAAPATVISQGGATMKLFSPAFVEGALIPAQYTCAGNDFSPPLTWSDIPAGAQSLALIADDPDAPVGTWVHWVAFNLPVTAGGLPEGIKDAKQLPGGGTQGTNSWRRIGYGGPCPPSGTHRYFFKLYALDKLLTLGNNTAAKDLQAEIKGHILAEAQLMGRFKR